LYIHGIEYYLLYRGTYIRGRDKAARFQSFISWSVISIIVLFLSTSVGRSVLTADSALKKESVDHDNNIKQRITNNDNLFI